MPDSFSHFRGLNYIPSWAGNAIGQWRFYDGPQATQELGSLAAIGCNGIRVWLNFAVWEVEGSTFLDKLAHLLAAARDQGLTVVVVLWDAVGQEPSQAPYDDLVDWTANPGLTQVSDPAFQARADAYVDDVVATVLASGAEVVWDVMNEPDLQPVSWIVHHAQRLASLDPVHPRTAGYFLASSAALTVELFDVVSFHPYGLFRRNVEAPADAARAAAGGRPLLASECGFPGGGGQRYEDVLDYLAGEELGFCLFQAMIGDNPHFPWRTGTGLLFPDGRLRDLEAVRGFQSAAKAQGFALEHFPRSQSPQSPLWVAYHPIPQGFGAGEWTALLEGWEGLYGGPEFPLVSAGDDGVVDFYDTLLTWGFASFVLAGVVSEDDVAGSQEDLAEVQLALAAGDAAGAEAALTLVVQAAAELLATHGLGEPPNRPPEILSLSAGPRPQADVDLRVEAWIWDPDGQGDVTDVTLLAHRNNGSLAFTAPLVHRGDGLYVFETAELDLPPAPAAGAWLTLLVLVTDAQGALDLASLTLGADELAIP